MQDLRDAIGELKTEITIIKKDVKTIYRSIERALDNKKFIIATSLGLFAVAVAIVGLVVAVV